MYGLHPLQPSRGRSEPQCRWARAARCAGSNSRLGPACQTHYVFATAAPHPRRLRRMRTDVPARQFRWRSTARTASTLRLGATGRRRCVSPAPPSQSIAVPADHQAWAIPGPVRTEFTERAASAGLGSCTTRTLPRSFCCSAMSPRSEYGVGTLGAWRTISASSSLAWGPHVRASVRGDGSAAGLLAPAEDAGHRPVGASVRGESLG